MSDEQKPKPKKNIFSSSKLQLTAPCPTAKGQYSKFFIDVYNGMPGFRVRTGDPADEANDYGIIKGPADPLILNMFAAHLQEMIDATSETKTKIECYNYDYANGQKSKDISLISELWLGRDAEGMIFVSVVAKNKERPVIKFVFSPGDSRFHKFYHSNGTQFSRQELSALTAKAWVTMITQMGNTIMMSEYTPPPTGQYGGGGNRGGYGGGNRQGGGYQGGGNRQGGGGYGGGNRQGGGAGGGAYQNNSKPAETVTDDDMPF